jgi:hypothetical protein
VAARLRDLVPAEAVSGAGERAVVFGTPPPFR